jgi:hypothetical protein
MSMHKAVCKHTDNSHIAKVLTNSSVAWQEVSLQPQRKEMDNEETAMAN